MQILLTLTAQHAQNLPGLLIYNSTRSAHIYTPPRFRPAPSSTSGCIPYTTGTNYEMKGTLSYAPILPIRDESSKQPSATIYSVVTAM